MLATKRLTLETLDSSNPEELSAFLEQVIAAGMEKVRAESAELQAKGIIDSQGKLLVTELPEDMRPGSGLDFGG
jgi:phosphosulfolactate synthase (CoM biosynthesis protein A)